MVEFKLENGIEVKVQNQYMYIEDLVKIGERKIIKALSQVDDKVKELMYYSYSYSRDSKEFSSFVIYPNDIYEQSEYLDSISDGYYWFTEGRDAYIINLTVHELFDLDSTDVAKMITDYANAYLNSVYIACSKDAGEKHGLLNEIYKIDEENERVYTIIEGIVLEHDEDMQQVAAYVLDDITGELIFRKENPDRMKYELNKDSNKCEWINVQ